MAAGAHPKTPFHRRIPPHYSYLHTGLERGRLADYYISEDHGETLQMDELLNNLRYAARTLMQRPLFTIVALSVLALGVGANTIVFSVVYGIMLKPLPFSDPDSIVTVQEHKDTIFNGLRYDPAYLEYQEWRDQAKSFQDVAGYRVAGYTLTGVGNPEQLTGANVTPEFFHLLGAQAQSGRTFTGGDDNSGPEVVLSYPLWQRRFGGSLDVVNKPITLNGNQYVVSGIMPADFAFPDRDTDLWTMIGPHDDFFSKYTGMHIVHTLARLKPAVAPAAAESEMNVIQRQVDQRHPDGLVGSVITVERLRDQMSGSVRPVLVILQVSVFLVLLIACANVASLLIGRASERRKEIAVRTALGANRATLVKQMLTESLLLAFLGGGLGLIIADLGLRLFLAENPFKLPRIEQVGLSLPVLAFTFGLVVLTGILFGLIPALIAPSVNVSRLLKEDARGTSAGTGSHRTRSVLVVAEVSLSLMLLVGAGLMMESLRNLGGVKIGIRPDNVLTMRIELGEASYPKPDERWAFMDRLIQNTSAVPGVQSVGLTSNLPLGGLMSDPITIQGKPQTSAADMIFVGKEAVTPDYFKTIGAELIRGREFDDNDRADTENVTVINQTMARQLFNGEDPIGKEIKNGQPEDSFPWMKVVGIVEDVRHMGLASQAAPEMFIPYRQVVPLYVDALARKMSLSVRVSNISSGTLATSIRDAIWGLNGDTPIYDVKTMDSVISDSVAEPRMRTTLLGAFAVVAIIMAAVGLYGVMSQAVLRRQHELGIRLALGASPSDVLRLVLAEGMALAVLGLAVGLLGAFALARLASSLLFGVSARDPLTYVTVSIFLLFVSLAASYLPARRATRVDPLSTLRSE